MNSVSDSTPVDADVDPAFPAIDEDAEDTGAIAWLLPEIVAAFDAATAALRAFRAGAAGVDPKDVDLAPLRIARSHVHQAHGALEMGELAGVTRLTDAIEDLLASFEAEPGRCDATALDAIIGGCRAIVEYLEDVQGGERQQPLRLFASYRELLLARRVDRIHPADLFTADLQVRVPRDDGPTAPLSDDALREQRSLFEQGLLRYLRNEHDAGALVTLARAVAAIEASVAAHPLLGQGQHRAYWWVTRAFFEALQHEGFASAPSHLGHIKRLAGRVNLQIRKLADGSAAVAERLFADTLFFVALAAPVTPHVRAVKARYRLDRAIPSDYETQRYGRIDAAVLRAARDALASAKAAWSAIVAGDVAQIPGFARDTGAVVEAVGPIRRRGLSQVAQVIDGIATDLGFDPRRPAPNVGLDVATALLFLESSLERARSLDAAFDERASLVVARVEAAVLGHDGPAPRVEWLDRMSREAEERLTLAAFVAELQASLQNAEKILDAFFRDPSERGALKNAERSLAQASGALSLLGHDDVHAAIDRARATIARFEQQPDVADAAAFEPLARSLGAVGFYVEQIKRERIDRDAFRFDAETGAFSADLARAPSTTTVAPDARLPWDTDDRIPASIPAEAVAPAAALPAVRSFAATDVLFAATEVLDPATTIEDEVARRAADAQGHVAHLREQPDDAATRAQLVAAVDDVRRSAMLLDDRELQDEAAAVLRSLRDGQHEPLGFASAAELADRVTELALHAHRAAGAPPPSLPPLAPSIPVPPVGNAEAIDAELLEIFLEEAEGVLADAGSSLRVLDADPESATATANLRRAFHTLKGSGRMVGLMAFGDAAWSIEDALNGHIADQRPASTDLRALVDYAIRYLADWVDELRRSGRSSRIPDALVEAAKVVRQDADTAHRHASAPDSRDRDDATVSRALSSAASLFDDDAYFAATQVIDDAADVPELEFFGLQPQNPEPPRATADPRGDAPAPAEVLWSATPVAADAHHEEVDFSNFLLEGVSAGEVDEPTAASSAAHGPVAEAPLDGTPEVPTPDEAALDPAEDLSLGFASDSLVSAGVAGEDEVAPEAMRDARAAVADNVVAFPFGEPTAPAVDDVRRIGSLTLSVALFNIYLTEADELLRVLTQDFAEWRHELDRYVSDGALRAVHSLAGSSATVGCTPAHDLAAGIEDVLQALWREPVVLRDDQVGRLQDAVESLRRMLHRFAAERMPEPDPVRLAALVALRREVTGDESATAAADRVAVVPETAGAPEAPEPPDAALPFEPLDFGDASSTHDATTSPVDAVDTTVNDVEAPVEQPVAIDPDAADRDSMRTSDSAEAVPDRIEDEVSATRPARIEGVEAEHVVAEHVEAEHVEAEHVAAQHVESEHVEAEHVEAEHVEAQHVEAQHVEAQHVETPALDAPALEAGAAPLADDPTLEVGSVGAEQAGGPDVDAGRLPADPVDAGSPHADPSVPGADASLPSHDGAAPDAPSPRGESDHDAPSGSPWATDASDIDGSAALDPRRTPTVDVASEASPTSPTEDAGTRVAPAPSNDDARRDAVDATARSEATDALVHALPLRDEIDPDLLDVFVAEGGEILPQIGTLLRTWQARPADAAPARTLLRHLHTLKGSARMAGAMRLGEVVHDLEARVESAARLHELPTTLVDELLASHDRSLELFDRLQHPAAMTDDPPAEAPSATMGSAAPDPLDPSTRDESVAAGPRVAPDAHAPAASKPAVRVDSETLDRLVNLAGEVSISRARIENEVHLIKAAMSDLNDNVERLRAQLREIEMQAEFQMQSQMQSQQASGREREKFDPLEFDRFTRFQELTRMMAESVNDVKTLQSNLQKSLDAAEGDLASQRRMTRDLQQDLMRVRMMPFSSIAERLYRVTRRTAKELDKRVNLDIRGGAVEMDRSVLERMAGPFEHLLRNHIVHGIEGRDARRAAGKDETGELLVEVRQEGNEIVLTFSDDGAGLDHDRIRDRGRALGLIGDGADDAEAAELIFHPGFSTAAEVTELAGRGVGMDVVRAEASVLAGRVSVDSTAGRGTRFTIHLPLTLAITQVVLVAVAGRVHALPAVLVEQVQQLRPQPLAEAYRSGSLDWAGSPVRLVFLGALLGDDGVPVAQRTSPVLILRSAGERIAIHVDEVIGNQEVVVKNLGPQLARMTGIAGATVLGSGQIVLILNPVQLAQVPRSDAVRAPSSVSQGDGAAGSSGGDLKTLPTVMVVDDSLTVRRVTQRLLSREGYQVVLAKDGVDALEQLQGYPPDVMLVDIEMPRMDGFDLTRNVRNDERYRHIPIIMITSRTAEKHRLHAAELGVDAYLGKPYGEDELLELLTTHIRAGRTQAA